MPDCKTILLVIGGGISAYKSLELIRRLREQGIRVRCVLTPGGREFITPLSLASISGEPVAEELHDAGAEAQFDHIQLSRSADLVVVAPATANLIARMAVGFGSDLASTLLLATDAPVMAAPAMNVRMWDHPATQRNVAAIRQDGVEILGPAIGDMACGETGPGRMLEPDEILAAILNRLKVQSESRPLAGKRAVVTAGPTHEPVDPVRFLGNRSSGKQGRAIAAALAAAGADVTLVAGPGAAATLDQCEVHAVETAVDMREAVVAALPASIFVAAAAVADWRPATARAEKIKKSGSADRTLKLIPNPDILAEVAGMPPGERPQLVVGFAAETGDPVQAGAAKRTAKSCDWIVANDVAAAGGVFGAEENGVVLITAEGAEAWPRMPKADVARRLVDRIAGAFSSSR